jgi:opacity protein-like surface antigen
MCLSGVLLAGTCSAQISNSLTFGVGGGFTTPVRWSQNRLDTGFNLTAHVGANISPYVPVKVEFGFNQLGIASTVLQGVGVPSGSTRIYSVTLNPEFHVNPRGRFDAYGTVGGGYYRRTVEFTQPSVAVFTGFDPFYGVFVPVGVPTQEVLGSFTQNKAGVNAGGGVSFRLKEDGKAKFFAEAKYHYLFTQGRTTILPVTFGFRW